MSPNEDPLRRIVTYQRQLSSLRKEYNQEPGTERAEQIRPQSGYAAKLKVTMRDVWHSLLTEFEALSAEWNLQGSAAQKNPAPRRRFRQPFIQLELAGANLAGADLAGFDLIGLDLSNATLQGANLVEADLSWADLSGADLRQANLTEAHLFEANLEGANLFGANLMGTNLNGARYNDTTIWPANFDPTKETGSP